MGKISSLLIGLSLVILLFGKPGWSQDNNGYQSLKASFLNPPATAHPKVYWWCLNGNIDTIEAKKEFAEMKKAEIRGFDFFEIGVPKHETMVAAGPPFMSDESVKIIRSVVREAGKLGLEMGLNLASSWNAGGAWTLPQHAGKSLYRSKILIDGSGTPQKINLPFPEISFPKNMLIGGTGQPMIPLRANGRPVYYEEVAILAIPASTPKNTLDSAKIINITPFFNPETEILSWKVPAGKWKIQRFVCSNSGQQLVLPSPNSAGLTIDHFDSIAVRTHLMYFINRLKPVLGDFRNTALKSFYLASYEARGFVWTPTLPNEFRKVNGYDMAKFLPSLFDQELFSPETTQKVQTDFKKALSELMINNLYKNSREICHRHGLKINCEAGGPGYPLYNGPAEPLKALGALDIPRGEFWINHSRMYKDSKSKDSIDILRVVKEVAAASHIYQKGIVEQEAFTSFQHWQEGPFDIKAQGDRAFCEGMNRVVFHGFSHNPAGTGFPGYVYGAGTHFNTKRVWWPKAKPFVDYLTRISAVFQQSDFVADVLYYYGDRIPNSATPKNTRFVAGAGYDYEVINTEILLNGLTVKNGKLVLSNGASFSLLALDDEFEFPQAVKVKLDELEKQGAVILGSKSKKPAEMLGALNIPPDIDYADRESFLIDFIHFRRANTDFYFIRNTSDQWVSRECSFRQQNKTPEIWDPKTGEIIPMKIVRQQGDYLKVPVTMAPFESYLVIFKDGAAPATFTGISPSGQNPPLMKFTRDGIVFLQEGTYELQTPSGVKRLENKQKTQLIDGDWKLTFTKGWGAPESVVFPELASWTTHSDDGIRYYSGVGTYHKTFRFQKNAETSKTERIFLDLGEIAKVAELWMNGHSLGIVWAKPYHYEVTNYIKNGENILKIEVANTWSNRLTGDAIAGEKYTNTNVLRTILPVKTIEPADQTRVPWAKVPPIESGLLGPVTIKTVQLVQ
jgi:hypothetical protein